MLRDDTSSKNKMVLMEHVATPDQRTIWEAFDAIR